MNQNDLILLDILLAEKSLYHYSKQAFKIIEPKTEFVDNWHIELLCDYLQCVSQNKQIDISIRKHFTGLTDDGRINNLLLCFPPRTLKSILVSIMLPSWHWIDNPHEKFLCGASSYRLSTHDSVKCRDIIKSDWYQDRWGDKYQLMDDQNTKQIYKNTEQGERMSVSVDSMVTGSGGDLLLADDLNDMGNIESQTNRENVLHFFNYVFSTRENNINTSRRITMQQRGHASDVAGDMVSKEDKIPLTKLIIKAIATEDETWISPLTGKVIKIRKAGELLSPNRMPKEFLDSMKVKLGSRGFEAQFQQSPKLEQGNIIKVNNFKYLKEDPKPIQIIQSIDTAFKTGEENDYSVVQTWFRFMLEGQQKYYLKSVLKGRFEFPELQSKVVELAKRFKPDKILIEDKASGQSLIQVLRQDKYLHHLILPIQVDKDKVTRAYAVTPIIERGDIYLPEASFWVEDFKAELSIFPYGEHDDQCFISGTKIATIFGLKNIENITTRDLIITPFGIRKVLNCGLTGIKPVIKNCNLIGTFDHNVFSIYGFNSLGIIKESETSKFSLMEMIKWKYKKLLNLMESNTSLWEGRSAIIYHSQRKILKELVLKDFMLQFGNFIINKKYKKAFIFITLTAILLITTLAIWSAFQLGNMARNAKEYARNLKKNILIKLETLQKNGTQAIKGKNGILNMAKIVLKKGRKISIIEKFALYVKKSLLHLGLLEKHAHQVVTVSKDDYLEKITLQSNAFTAEKILLKTGTIGQFVAQENALNQEQEVYNLTVDIDGVYYANGILVSNCDAFTQAMNYLDDQKAGPRIRVI